MPTKPYIVVSGALFGVIALLQLLRAFSEWPVQVASLTIPVWLSWIAALVTGSLAVWAFNVARR